MVRPATNTELVEQLKAKDVTLIALDCVPRITRAQKMDGCPRWPTLRATERWLRPPIAMVVSSVVMTAAGKSPPAKVLVIGAGVAGLAAIGAARGLGAVVRALMRVAAGGRSCPWALSSFKSTLTSQGWWRRLCQDHVERVH